MVTTLYGLPEDVRFCTRCVISNQRPASAIEYQHTVASRKRTIAIDAEGVCSACRAAEVKAAVDWRARRAELGKLCDLYRRTSGNDCIVPGSGGKDSFFQAHLLRDVFGMHPLTITWAPTLATEVGRRNHQAWIDAGFDNILVTPNGRTQRLLTRIAIENLFHPFHTFILGQKALAPKIALEKGIQLIFYGENEAEYGNPIADMKLPTRDSAYFTAPGDIRIGGASIDELTGRYGLSMHDLGLYLPASAEAVREAGVQVHYLGYYERWTPQECYYFASDHGFQCAPTRTAGTYSKYNSIDDKIDDLHYWTTWIKFGLGRASYDAAQEIRNGHLTREEGVALVHRFDGEWPDRFEPELAKYLSIPAREFPIASREFACPEFSDLGYLREIADRFRSPHLWERDATGWRLRHRVA